MHPQVHFSIFFTLHFQVYCSINVEKEEIVTDIVHGSYLGYIIEWIYHSQGLMKFSRWGFMQYVRHWTLDLQFVFDFRKVYRCQRSKEL